MNKKSIILLFVFALSHIASASGTNYCQPNESCWPKQEEWKKLKDKVHGRLLSSESYLEPCKTDPQSSACITALKNSKNPFFVEAQSEATQFTGWLNAWNSAPSPYVIAAQNAEDIVAGVNFARQHHLRIVVKGTGHDFLGRSNAPNSLLIWTHNMRKITMHDSFVCQGCPAGFPAVTVEAGARWLEVYNEVISKHGRYVQGGGCTSVGAVGGFSLGGGFGEFSKKFGTGAANMLEAEVVTADGKILIANAYQNKDLFWALRGGGGGTFGIVTKITYRTHELPKSFGVFEGSIIAEDDQAYKQLLSYFIPFYRENLSNEHWGGYIFIQRNNVLKFSLQFQELNKAEVEKIWHPFKDSLVGKKLYKIENKIVEIPPQKMWDYNLMKKIDPNSIVADVEEKENHFWWKTHDKDQASQFLYSYLSRWLPMKMFKDESAPKLAEALFQASRHWDFELHLQKGQAGASPFALKHGKETSMNPELFNAALMFMLTTGKQDVFPNIKGFEPNITEGENVLEHMKSAIRIIREATPGAGAYVNEVDYFEPDWQRTLWGENYPRLLSIKRKYDPANIFTCHHCVGSETLDENTTTP